MEHDRSLNQSYATLVYGDGEYACAAAVLVRALRELDEHRPITVVALNVSSATARLLEASATGTRVVHGPPLTHTSRRKMLLWSLPFDKVLFLDADHIPAGASLVESHSRGPRSHTVRKSSSRVD